MESKRITEGDAITTILNSRGKFALHLGAGVSVSAGVPMASRICDDIRRREFDAMASESLPPADIEARLDKRLNWSSVDQRYTTCISKGLKSPSARIDYFRALLRDKQPSFSHHAAALLMDHNLVRRTCLTTNFDKLITSAFFSLGRSEFQPIRTPDEIPYWVREGDKCFSLMLHGDYDTRSIRNLEEETGVISAPLRDASRSLLQDSGLIVLGSSGQESSIGNLMEDLASDDAIQAGTLAHGLLWGVYVGDEDDPDAALEHAIESGQVVSARIKRLMDRSWKRPMEFAFFPIRSSDSFFDHLVRRTRNADLIRSAKLFLDHGNRVRRTLEDARFSEAFIREHVGQIQSAKDRAERGAAPNRLDTALALQDDRTGQSIVFVYGDITNEGLALHPRLRDRRRAIVSSDDTFFTAGGGVSLGILQRAGPRAILNELEKFPKPVAAGEVLTTSSGTFLTQYIMHAAIVGLEPTDGGRHSVQLPTVDSATINILRQMDALGIEAVYLPILGAGLGRLEAEQSLAATLSAINESKDLARNATLLPIVFSRNQIAPDRLAALAETQLPRFRVVDPAPWSFP